MTNTTKAQNIIESYYGLTKIRLANQTGNYDEIIETVKNKGFENEIKSSLFIIVRDAIVNILIEENKINQMFDECKQTAIEETKSFLADEKKMKNEKFYKCENENCANEQLADWHYCRQCFDVIELGIKQNQTILLNIKKDDLFKLKENGNEIWIRGEFDRQSKTFACYSYDDINKQRNFKSNRMIFID